MAAEWLEAAEKLLPYLLGSSGVIAWLHEKQARREELGNIRAELQLKARELEDARAQKSDDLLRARDLQMYEELRGYCTRLESRIEKLENKAEADRLAVEAAQALAHSRDLELRAAQTRLEMIQGKCSNSCGLVNLIIPASVQS